VTPLVPEAYTKKADYYYAPLCIQFTMMGRSRNRVTETNSLIQNGENVGYIEVNGCQQNFWKTSEIFGEGFLPYGINTLLI
jgi:hypothetical protein